MSVLVTV